MFKTIFVILIALPALAAADWEWETYQEARRSREIQEQHMQLDYLHQEREREAREMRDIREATDIYINNTFNEDFNY